MLEILVHRDQDVKLFPLLEKATRHFPCRRNLLLGPFRTGARYPKIGTSFFAASTRQATTPFQRCRKTDPGFLKSGNGVFASHAGKVLKKLSQTSLVLQVVGETLE